MASTTNYESQKCSPTAQDHGYNNSGVTIPQGRGVKRANDAVDGVLLTAASTDIPYGVSTAEVLNGAHASFITEGVAVVEAGAAMATNGVGVMLDSAGKAIAWVAGSANVRLGWLRDTASAAGEFVRVELAIGYGTT